jgi:hypothetical protein
MSQRYYLIAKRNYDAGLWNRAMLENLLNLGRLTQVEFDDIVGNENE